MTLRGDTGLSCEMVHSSLFLLGELRYSSVKTGVILIYRIPRRRVEVGPLIVTVHVDCNILDKSIQGYSQDGSLCTLKLVYGLESENRLRLRSRRAPVEWGGTRDRFGVTTGSSRCRDPGPRTG